MRTYATEDQIARWLVAVDLRDQGWKLREIAEAFGISIPSVDRLIIRGRKYLLCRSMQRRRR